MEGSTCILDSVILCCFKFVRLSLCVYVYMIMDVDICICIFVVMIERIVCNSGLLSERG